MNFASERGNAGLIIFLLLVLLGLVGGGIYMLDEIGLINARQQIMTQVEKVPYVGEVLAPGSEPTESVRRDELRQYERELEQRAAEIEQERASIEETRDELEQTREQLDQQRQQLEQREQALLERQERFENDEARYEYLAELHEQMAPADAAQRLQGIEQDTLVISILRQMETANASIILSEMNPQRASELSRQITQLPDF